MQTVEIGRNQAGQRMDKFLRKLMPEAGTGFLYKMLRKKNITLNGKQAKGSEILTAGDQISVFFSPETFAKMTGADQTRGEKAAEEYVSAYRSLSGTGISVLYEDGDILVANKPAGLLSQKAEASDVSLNEWLIGYLLERQGFRAEELNTFRPSVCNRLDRNTSGIVFCGKSLAGVQHIGVLLRERRIEKLYRTICLGEMNCEMTLRGYLEKDEARNKAAVTAGRPQAVSAPEALRENPAGKDRRRAVAAGKAAEPQDVPASGVYVETVCRPLAVSMGYTLLEVELVTGKTHQIRAQLAGAGYPLIGDFKYGDGKINRLFQERYGLNHQLLHACEAVFMTGGQERKVRAPYPELFQTILAGLGFRKM